MGSSRCALNINTRAPGSSSEASDIENLRGNVSEAQRGGEDLMLFASPVGEPAPPRALGTARLPAPTPEQRALQFAQAYGRRMSQSQPTSPPPTNSKHRDEWTKKRVEVDYGPVRRHS